MKELSYEEQVKKIRNLCRTNLYFLISCVFNRSDIEKEWLFDRCNEVQDSPNGHLDLWAREFYKSTIITFALTIQEVLKNPNITIGIFSHTRPIAKGFLRQIKRELEGNEQLKRYFPDILYENPSKQALKWSEDDGIIVKRSTNPKESTIEAWGVVDGQPTSKHFDLLIYDDIVTRESVTTPEMIDKTIAALELSFNLGARGGHKRFIGTRYHFNDSYKTLMDRGTVIPRIYPATHDGTLTGDPVFLSHDDLAIKRRDMGIYTYSTQMLQNPIADNTQGFKREWIKKADFDKEGLNWYLLVDSANSKKKGSDYTAIWAVGLGEDRNYYCIPEVRDRLNLTERANRLIELHKKYKPVQVRYERYGLMADVDYIKVMQEQQNYRFDIVEVAGSTPKPDRIKRLVPLFESGLMYLPETHKVTDYEGKTCDNVHIFIEQELIPFPVAQHDDMLDALARISEPKHPLSWPMQQEEIKHTFQRGSAWA